MTSVMMSMVSFNKRLKTGNDAFSLLPVVMLHLCVLSIQRVQVAPAFLPGVQERISGQHNFFA